MGDSADRARSEFVSEAQEIVDHLSRDLLLLDATTRVGPPDPELVNSVFRAVHTLKGLCGLYSASGLASLSQGLEDLLDAVRMGRTEMTADLFDFLFRAVELYHRLLGSSDDAAQAGQDLDRFIREMSSARGAERKDEAAAEVYALDPGMLAVLTEYEEHRLRTNLKQGKLLYRIRASFLLSTIDEQLEALKVALKPFGEILTYLPAGDGSSVDSIDLEVLYASKEQSNTVRGALLTFHVTVEELQRIPSLLPDSLSRRTSVKSPVVDLGMTVPPPAILEAQFESRESLSVQRERTLRSAAQTVRVDIQRLDHLMNLVGQLSIVQDGLANLTEQTRSDPRFRGVAKELARLHRSFDRHLDTMQTAILDVRMVPLGQVFEKLARVVRQASREVHKEVNLVITGADTEVDKLIGEELSDPLMHMIRNALDHGIENVSERTKVGKPSAGTIALNAYQKGKQVVVEIEDDGGGIDDAKLVEAAVAARILPASEARDLSMQEKWELVFRPGVSTRTTAGELSGRGVGMDVVKTNISKLGGVVDVHSERGIGSKFTITLPITLAMISALMVRVGDDIYAFPLASVQEALMLDRSTLQHVEGREVATLRGSSLPLCRLQDLFASPQEPTSKSRTFVVIASAASRRCGFVVDDILDRRDIVIKALSGPLTSIGGFAGATELGGQRVALVLDVPGLLEEVLRGQTVTRALRASGHE